MDTLWLIAVNQWAPLFQINVCSLGKHLFGDYLIVASFAQVLSVYEMNFNDSSDFSLFLLLLVCLVPEIL